jgi:hypothetical protein
MKRKLAIETFLLALGLSNKKIFYVIKKIEFIKKITALENQLPQKSLIKLNETITNKESSFLRIKISLNY